ASLRARRRTASGSGAGEGGDQAGRRGIAGGAHGRLHVAPATQVAAAARLQAFHAGAARAIAGIDGHHLVHAHPARVDATVEHGLVQGRVDRGEVVHGLADAGLFELEVAFAAQFLAAFADLADPLLESGLVQGVEAEAHAGEAGAAVVGREAL